MDRVNTAGVYAHGYSVAENLEYTAVWNSAMLQTQVRCSCRGWRSSSPRVVFDRADFDVVVPGSQDIASAFVASRKKQKPEFRPLGPKL